MLGALVAASVWCSCDGCLGLPTSPVDQPDAALPSSCEAEAALVQPQRLDILFVIDDSSSMAEEQDAVARELTSFIEVIRAAGGVEQDFHVGVITTSVYQNTTRYRTYPQASGRLQPVPDAEDGGATRDGGAERMLRGQDPQLVAKLSRLVRQGTNGSGQETPFEAVRLALVGDLASIPIADGGNQGFMRDGARLLVVVLSDEDDCSEVVRPPRVAVGADPLVADCTEHADFLLPVAQYHRLFTTIANRDGSPKDVVWAAIVPVSRATPHVAEPVIESGAVRNVDCPTSSQAGLRHLAMAQLFDPSLANVDSICRDSFHDTLVRIASLAAVSQVLDVTGVTDARLLRMALTRGDGGTAYCTLGNGGLLSVTPTGHAAAKVQFGNQCRRRSDDSAVAVQILCAL